MEPRRDCDFPASSFSDSRGSEHVAEQRLGEEGRQARPVSTPSPIPWCAVVV
jgi:hypothetical protein